MTSPTSPLPGRDWADPRSTTTPRQRTTAQRLALLAVATVTLGLGLASFASVRGERGGRQALGFRLEEVDPAASGLDFTHHKPTWAPFFDNMRPFFQAVSAAACTADVDRDGHLDVLFVDSGAGSSSALFFGSGRFTFERAPVPALEHLNDDGYTTDCLFADVDGDGWDDLYLTRMSAAPVLLRNVAAAARRGFEDVSQAAGLVDYLNGYAAAFLDVDGDGDLDLLTAGYYAERYAEEDVPGAPRIHPTVLPSVGHPGRFLPNNWGAATNGGRKHLLLNDGHGRFAEVDAVAWGLGSRRFTFDIGTGDVDGDGDVDAYFANDFGPDELLLNEGGRFVEQRGVFPNEVGKDPYKGMNADFADLDGDGYPEIHVSNVFHPVLPEGTLLWRNVPGRTPGTRRLVNQAYELGVKNGGWGWGAKFVDLDLDGDFDLVASAGYISQSPAREYWYQASRVAAGRSSIIHDSQNWPPFADRSMSGHQLSKVFVNDGLRFTERAEEVGVARRFDGRGVAVGDFDEDGRPDPIVVAQGERPLVLRNRAVGVAGRSVTLVLEGDGAKVNTDAVGARVAVTPAGGAAQHFELSAGNSMAAQSMRWVLVGVPGAAATVEVTVRWPGAAGVETFRGLRVGARHVLRFGEGAKG